MPTPKQAFVFARLGVPFCSVVGREPRSCCPRGSKVKELPGVLEGYGSQAAFLQKGHRTLDDLQCPRKLVGTCVMIAADVGNWARFRVGLGLVQG